MSTPVPVVLCEHTLAGLTKCLHHIRILEREPRQVDPMNGATRERQRLAASSAVDAALSFPAVAAVCLPQISRSAVAVPGEVEMSSCWFLSPTGDGEASCRCKFASGYCHVARGCCLLVGDFAFELRAV